jgi:DnaJ domain
MTLDPDPYRTLGLERGAPLADVKRAYRRLAKANHPDAAGEAALPRFLAIQAAYDQIAGPDGGTPRLAGRGPARRAWEADADRAGATYRAYGGRPRQRPGAAPGPRPRPNPRPTGSERPGAERADRTGSDRRPKKATLGSTSYDDVDAESFDPDWGGASWYGTTSGTYWTLNPKEYADPRKHGPEYQARARRAATGNGSDDPERVAAADPAGTPGAIGVDAAEPAATTPPPPTHTSTSWWQATTGDATARSEPDPRETPTPPGRSRAAPPVRPQTTTTSATTGTIDDRSAGADLSVDAAVDSLRRWLDDDRPSLPSRLGRGFVAWMPVALGIGWGLGELSGCGRFAATCDPSVAPISWVVQLAMLALLILLPRLARIGVLAAAGSLTPVFLASVLLFTSDPAATDTARSILGAMMAVGWGVGLVFGIGRELRREARPVS